MMRRGSSGRGSLQVPGVLKPRNEAFTPTNRQSSGQSTRRSYISKVGQGSSGQQHGSRMTRRSAENRMMRSSTLGFNRFTPTRSNTPSMVPSSANRLSTDSVRNSGMGTSTKKDTRYVFDPNYKTQCINKILEFLRNGYHEQYSRRTLLTPTTRDFTNIFNFIFQHFEPTYSLPTRFEDEVPKLLKKLHCPIQLTKSSFITVGSPHTWPAILASLAFLVDIIHCDNIMRQDQSSFPSDFDDDEEGGNVKLDYCIEIYKCNDENEIKSIIESYGEKLKEEERVTERHMMALQQEVEEAERALESLPDTAEELRQLQQCYSQYSDDLVKLTTYLQDLKVVIQNKITMENNLKQRIEELNAEEIKILEEVEYLKRLQLQQNYSSTNLIYLKNHSQEAGKEIELLEQVSKESSAQVWNMELEMSKVQSSLRNSLVLFEDLTEKLELKEDFFDNCSSIDGLTLHYDDIMHKLIAHKKAAKKATSRAHDKMWKTDQDVEKAKGMLQEIMIEHKKLETKMRHNEEEYEVTREEIAREEQARLEESELLHQKIMEARKTNKKPSYHMHQLHEMMDNKKLEVESFKVKEETCLRDGVQFLMKVYQEGFQSAELKRNMILEHTTRINTTCDELLEWLDLQDID